MERITLNIIPKGITPVCHASQFDIGRVIRCDIMDDLQGYVFSDETVELRVRKPDDNVVTASVDVVSGDTFVLIETTEQMTACDGVNKCELRIMKGDVRIGSLNFDMKVEVDPLKDGIESETVIHNLESMVDEMVAEEVAEQYDSANVIFDNEPTENHGIGYTVTSKGIKTAIDNAFDYDNTASGSLVHITDGADNIPVKSLASEIVATQSGSGTPSPSNPRAISGFDSGVVSVCGKNFLSLNNVDFTLKSVRYYTSDGNFYLNGTSTGETSSRDETFRTNLNFLLKAGTYYFSRGNLNIATYLYDYEDNTKPAIVTNSGSFTLTEDTRVYIGFYVYNQTFDNLKSEIMVNIGSTATTYEPYTSNTYTFSFGQTVYGGHFDNKGNLVVTHKVWVTNGSENWTDSGEGNYYTTSHYSFDSLSGSNNGNSNYFTYKWSFGQINGCMAYSNRINLTKTSFASVEDLQVAFNQTPLVIVYPLATPITLAITSQDIPTLLGVNNIFSNCGDVEVNYYTNKSNDILEFIDSEIGKKNGTNILIEANSQDSIKDYIDDEVSTINTSLAEKADTNSVYVKTESFYCPQSHDFESGTTSSDAIIWFINTYGTKPMSFGFVITGLGWFECFLTFYSDSQGGGILLLNGSSRLWAVTYINGVITLTEK